MTHVHDACQPDGCGCCLSRRGFVKGCGAALALAAGADRAPGEDKPAGKGVRVAVVFLSNSRGREMWPYPNFDCAPRHKAILAALRKGCANVAFVPVVAKSPADAKKAIALKDTVDGYIVYCVTLSFGLRRVLDQVAALRKPTIVADEVLGGTAIFLIGHSLAARRKLPVVGVSSRRDADLVAAAGAFAELAKPGATPAAFVKRCGELYRGTFPAADTTAPKADRPALTDIGRCVKRFRASHILIVGRGKPGSVHNCLGAKATCLGFGELKALYDKADPTAAARWADRWTKQAKKVVEPKPDVIRHAGAMYLATLELMKRHKADTVTMNCLGGFASGKLPSYPCLGFMQLLDDGRQGVCEAMTDDSLSMLMARILTGRPGYVSDPAIDTSKGEVIYAHCVATTKVFGPEGAQNPYDVRSLHNRDPRGVCTQSFLPEGYMTTSFRTNYGRKELVIHQARSSGNVISDYGCRTKLRARVVGDIEKLMRHWDRFGWHRVTTYGDVKAPLIAFGKALGLKTIVEET